MSLWRKFIALNPKDRRLLLSSSLWVGSIWLGLRILPFRMLHRLLNHFSRPRNQLNKEISVDEDRIIWAVTTSSRWLVGKDACLPQALAGQLILLRNGFPATLKIGAKKTEDGKFIAHAWVVSGKRVLIGGDHIDLNGYQPLIELEESVS